MEEGLHHAAWLGCLLIGTSPTCTDVRDWSLSVEADVACRVGAEGTPAGIPA